jgi:hypothetical protein
MTLPDLRTKLEEDREAFDDLDNAVDGLLSYANVMTLPELRTKLEEDREAFDDLDNAVGGLLSYANVMTLPDLRTKLEEDREAFDDLDNAVGGLLSYANVMTLPDLRTKLESDAQAHTDLQGEVDAVLRAAGVMDLDQLEMAYDDARSDYNTLVEHVNTVVSAAGLTGTGATGVTNLQTAYNTAKSDYDNLNTLVQNVLTATGTTDRDSDGERDLTDLQALVTHLNSEVSRLAGEVRRLQQNAQTDRTELENQVSEAEQATVNARAGAYLDALTPTGDAMPAPRTGVSVTHDRGGSLTINPGGNFQSGSGAPGISGFTARAYTREVGVEGEETLYLYTNIQAPSTRHFWKIHGLEVASAHTNADFNPTPTASARYIPHSTDSTMAAGVRVSGRYDGVSGTFTCVDSDCMGAKDTAVDLTALVPLVDDERSFAQGSWTFKPSSITGGVSQMRDNEHLYFGIWVREPNVASEEHAFQYIAGGLSNGDTQAAALTNFSALSGTATFGGGAIGKYVTRNQVGENAKIGTFTAAANFTANFDDNNLEGRITNFRDGGQALPGDWNVYLGTADNAPASFTGGSLTDAVSSGRIGGVPATGDWSATLYGTDNTVLADEDREDYPATRYPVADLAGLTGSFRASSTNAALAGTFGATPSN